MVADEGVVIHLIDVIARKDQNQIGVAALDESEVLLNGIGGADEPACAARLVGGEDLEAAGELPIQIPGAARADVLDEGLGAVLGDDDHVKDVGVDAVGEREINNAVFPGIGHGGLGALEGQDAQPRTFSTRQDDGAGFHDGDSTNF